MNFTRGLAIVTVALAVAFAWWLLRPLLAVPAPAVVASPKPAPVIIHTAQIETTKVAAPVAPPAPVHETPEPGPIAQVVADQESSNPRLAPDTAIADFTQLVDTGDYVDAAATYVQLPANVTAAQFVNGLQQNPDANFPQLVQMVQDTMRATQGVAPVYNDTGDTATYNFPVPVDGQASVRWKKIGDNWYLDAIGN